jgi:REDY-like protein HapK
VDIIVHRIRLRAGVEPARFTTWVREVDYATCSQLPSVLSFSVQRVSDDPAAPIHFFEVIAVDSREAFERDMLTPAFRGLVEAFDRMAVVVDECVGSRIQPGYAAGQ